MKYIFNPGKCILNKISEHCKLCVVVLTFLFLISFILFFLIESTQKWIGFTEKEIRGVEYIKPLSEFLYNVQLHRLTLDSYNAGNKKAKMRFELIQKQIEQNLKDIEAIDSKYGKKLSTSNGWREVKDKWLKVKEKSLKIKPLSTYVEHTILASTIVYLINEIGDRSNLIVDPELCTHYLINSVVSSIPRQNELYSEIGSLAIQPYNSSGVYKTKQKLIFLSELNLNHKITNGNFQKVIQDRPDLQPSLEVFLVKYNVSSGIFKDIIQGHLGNEKFVSPLSLTFITYQTLESSNMLMEKYLLTLKKLLNNRVEKYNRKKFISIIAVILIFLLISYLAISYYYQKKESEEIKGTFLATLTHDMKSPILAEQKVLEAVFAKDFNTKLKDLLEYLQAIYQTNEELLRIVNNILTVYHYEHQKIKLNKVPVDINSLVKKSVHTLEFLAKDNGSEVAFIVDENLPDVVADNDLISRVVINLLGNAIKHNKKGTDIHIKTSKKDSEVLVSVADNGLGIPDCHKDKIFQRYPTKKREVGTGLGLYISKQIVEAHGGRIWFDSKEGQGTKFSFALPVS